MLPNHSPCIAAEQYATLEVLFPGCVDLGLGRAPGSDMQAAKAIRRTDQLYPEFEKDVEGLLSCFGDTAAVHTYPAAGMDSPLSILGSSTTSAYFAARMGLPYSFAAHFVPADMDYEDQIGLQLLGRFYVAREPIGVFARAGQRSPRHAKVGDLSALAETLKKQPGHDFSSGEPSP